MYSFKSLIIGTFVLTILSMPDDLTAGHGHAEVTWHGGHDNTYNVNVHGHNNYYYGYGHPHNYYYGGWYKQPVVYYGGYYDYTVPVYPPNTNISYTDYSASPAYQN